VMAAPTPSPTRRLSVTAASSRRIRPPAAFWIPSPASRMP
jgi:hypothetical protein